MATETTTETTLMIKGLGRHVLLKLKNYASVSLTELRRRRREIRWFWRFLARWQSGFLREPSRVAPAPLEGLPAVLAIGSQSDVRRFSCVSTRAVKS
jgi:hypothetical protein